MVLQEIAPWSTECSVVPIALCAALTLAVLVRRPDLRRRRWNHWTARGLVLGAAAVGCFAKGLDEDADYLRMWHGAWHVFITLGSAALVKGAMVG